MAPRHVRRAPRTPTRTPQPVAVRRYVCLCLSTLSPMVLTSPLSGASEQVATEKRRVQNMYQTKHPDCG